MDVNFIRQVLRDVLSSPQSAAPRTVRVEDIRHSSWVGNMLSTLGFLPQVQLAPPSPSLLSLRIVTVSPSNLFLPSFLPSSHLSSSPPLLSPPPLLSSTPLPSSSPPLLSSTPPPSSSPPLLSPPPLLSSPLLSSCPLLPSSPPLLSSLQGRVLYLPVDAIDLTLLQQAMHIVEGIELAVARSAIPVASTEEEDEDHMITDQSDPSSAEGYLPVI